MVELQSKRRKVQQKATIEKKNRYSAEYEFSALTYKQAPKTLALSPHSVLVSAQNNHFNALAGDFYLDKEHVYNSPIPVMEKHHKQNVITHLKWHPKGDVVASIDETGQLALWQLKVKKKEKRVNTSRLNHYKKTAVDTWATTYQLDLKQPLAAFLWLNTEPSVIRLYFIIVI
jgi:WD40 repeat protein